jgi:hypothetical protein
MLMPYKRLLSAVFMRNLIGGLLTPILNRIRQDETLMLAIRENYVNVYYRGGSLLKISVLSELTEISPNAQEAYRVEFDANYNKGYSQLNFEFPFEIRDVSQALHLVSEMSSLKFVMDRFFALKKKSEREFQQLVVRENNSSSVSRETDYFIVDIEVSGLLAGAQYDMLAVRWLDRRKGRSGILVPALIEMKYGSGALDGSSGITKHLKDVCSLISNKVGWLEVVRGLEAQLVQLDELGLLHFNHSSRSTPLKIDVTRTPEFIFLLANYNPAGTRLKTILDGIDNAHCEASGIDLLFFVSAFSGYGMHRASMLNLEEFKGEVERLNISAFRKQI